MNKWVFLAVLVFLGALAWYLFSQLSSDAVSMALGLFFGVLAGVPTAILVLAGQRQRDARHFVGPDDVVITRRHLHELLSAHNAPAIQTRDENFYLIQHAEIERRRVQK